MSKAASMPSAVRRPLSFERGSLALFASLAVLIAGLVSLDTGLTGVGLFILGGLLGAVFLLFQYGFASVWRHALMRGEVMGLAAHFLLIGLCAIVFIPASSLGLSAAGTVAPVTISLFVGAFIFGLGMQLANGCGSGVLFSFGSGSGRMMVALPFFIIGSVLGSFLLPSALGWGSAGPVAIAGGLSDGLRTIVNLAFISVAGFGFYLLGRHRGQQLSKRLVLACLLIAALCWAVYVLSGHPWGVTFGFTLWGAKLAQDIGIPVENFTFWQWPGPARALSHSLLSDISSLMNIGMVLGAAMVAAGSGQLSRQNWPSGQQLVAAAVGGVLMGIGARLSFGCNIGAFLGGIASGSLHGWIWFVVAMTGSWAGIQIRPRFGLEK